MIDWKLLIERHPDVMLGKPVFSGTRITVEFVLERLAQGATADELVENNDGLKPEHISAALAYAAAALRHDNECEFNDETIAAIKRADEQFARGEGIDFDEFAADMRKRIAVQ